SLAVGSDGLLYAWGSPQLDTLWTNRTLPSPVNVSPGSRPRVLAVAAGGDHDVALIAPSTEKLGYEGRPPVRLLDTRPGAGTVDGLQAGIGRLQPGQVLRTVVGGRAGVPYGTAAAVLNVTVTAPASAGFLT